MQRQGWKEATLGQVLTLQRGFDITKNEQKDGPYWVISSSGPKSKHADFKVKGPGVVIGRKGTLGTAYYSQLDFWPHDTTLWVKDFHGNDEKFAYYFLSSMRLEQYDCGSSNPTINRNHIHLLPVSYPPLETQRKIASILSAYDDLIENNTRRIKILEEMAQAIYREWFVNFRFPGHEKARMVDSPLGRVPEGWGVGRLQNFIELCYGKALKAEDRHDGPFPVYGSSGIVGKHSESLVDGPGIIVGRKGNVGSVHWTDRPFYPIDTVYYVKTEISLYYTYYNFQNQNFINNDAAVPGLNRNQAYALPFLLPQKQVLYAFDEFCAPIFCQVRSLSLKNQNLHQTRDLLLPKLISGEVEVSELAV